MLTTAQKAEAFRQLHLSPGAFIIPNPWDVGSARLLGHAGFQALATTSAGLAFANGMPDNTVPKAMLLTHLRELAACTSLPISADLENGYGQTPEEVHETVRLALETGVVGCSIEDSVNTQPNTLLDIGLAKERVRAAVEAARALPYPVTVTGRAENFFIGKPDLPDVIRRLQAYQDAGADVLYAPGLQTADEIRAVVTSVDRPVNVMLGAKPSALTLQVLAELGVKRISVGGTLARIAYGALLHAAREMATTGTFDYSGHPMSQVGLSAIFRASPDYQERRSIETE